MVEELNEQGGVVVQEPPVSETPVPTAESVTPDPLAEAKAAAEAAKAETETLRAEVAAAKAATDAAKADAEIARRALMNPPAAPVVAAPTDLTDEQKAALEEKHGKPYAQIVADAELTKRIVSRGTAPLLREQKIVAMRERHGVLFVNHEKAFREQLANLSPDVELTDGVADGILRYVVGDAVVGAGTPKPAAEPAARPAGTGRRIVGGTGLEGTQGDAPSPAPATSTKLSDDQKFVARKMGLTEAEYLESMKKNAVR